MTEKTDYMGMTVNERSFASGTLRAFDEAIRQRDRASAMALLLAIDVEHPDRAVEAALADPAWRDR